MVDKLKTTCLYGWLLLLGTVDRVRKWLNPKGSDEAYYFTDAEHIELKGCPNLFKVDDCLYRGGQPTPEGFKALEQMGIRTVLNLRSMHDNDDKLTGTDLKTCHIQMKTWDPKPDQIEEFLSIVTNPDNQPVFVHCLHGSDRTGLMVAAYRTVVQGYHHADAVHEMVLGPFGFHRLWQKLPDFLSHIDVEGLRKKYSIRIGNRPPREKT